MSYRSYLAEIHAGLGYLATWLPSFPIQLGDVARFTAGQLHRVCSISDLGIGYVPLHSNTKTDYRYMTRNAVHLAAKGEITAPIDGGGASSPLGMLVSFSRAGAVMFEAHGCASTSIADIHTLGAIILKRYLAGEWDAGLFVVTETVSATSATILISGGDKATLDLKSSAGWTMGGSEMIPVNAKLEATASSGLTTVMLSKKGLVPLYRAWGVRRRAFGLRAATFSLRGAASNGDSSMRELSPDDLFVTDSVPP
jgi:hypothetical protein